MKIFLLSMLIVFSIVIHRSATAQPLFTTLHDWTFDTPVGPVGYQQIRQDPVGIRHHYLMLGPKGRVRITAATMAVASGVLMIALGGVIAMAFARQRRHD